jgi:hypothetical protein
MKDKWWVRGEQEHRIGVERALEHVTAAIDDLCISWLRDKKNRAVILLPRMGDEIETRPWWPVYKQDTPDSYALMGGVHARGMPREHTLLVFELGGFPDPELFWEMAAELVEEMERRGFTPQSPPFAEDGTDKKPGPIDTKLDTLLAGQTAIREHLSCFISYSSKDQTFAERLCKDLQGAGVCCWFALGNMKIGAKIRPALDESIRGQDKLLLILSKHSIASQWVEQEVETALARERKEGRIILLPIRVDNAVMEIESGWPALIRNTRYIGDFCHWENDNAYQKAFERLLRDLKAEEEAGATT